MNWIISNIPLAALERTYKEALLSTGSQYNKEAVDDLIMQCEARLNKHDTGKAIIAKVKSELHLN
jgi:hypothetical protein